MKKVLMLIGLVFAMSQVFAQDTENYSGPIIDMHLHSKSNNSFRNAKPNPLTGELSATNVKEHYQQSIALMKKYNIVMAMVDCRSFAWLDPWLQMLGDDAIIKGRRFNLDENISDFRNWASEGKIELFGEVGAIYKGYSPSDSILYPYYKICEQFDIPVGIHTGGSHPGITFRNKNFRLRLGDPFLVEDMLVDFPKLRVYLMHAGVHFYERTIMLMLQYPNLYVDISALNWIPDAKNFLSPFLKLSKNYKVLNRVMYGTDQSVWPESIEIAIENVQSLDFLTLEEKKGIFYDNAARFLKLSDQEIAKHHGN